MSRTHEPKPGTTATADPLLRVERLDVRLEGRASDTPVSLVNDVSFELRRGRTLGIVGESGSGKSMTMLATMGLLPPGVDLSSGSVWFDGRDLTSLNGKQLSGIRGARVGMIFQDPVKSLNPAYRVGEQIAEGIRHHQGLSRRDAWDRAVELLDKVGIPDPAQRAQSYPHQFSGGMAQRVMIAMAIACDPEVLIADEPTTALDVTVQKQILRLLSTLSSDLHMAMVLVSHDFGVIANTVDDVIVMYAGQIVEQGPVAEVLANPQHPYTEALLAASPESVAAGERLNVIPGRPPSATKRPPGCRFAPRCQYATPSCEDGVPDLVEATGTGRLTRCVRHDELVLEGSTSHRADGSPPDAGPSDRDILVEVNGMTKDFVLPGRSLLRAVNDVDLAIRAGEVLGLVGESGSGKSTLGRLMMGLLEPTAGSAVLEGRRLDGLSSRERRRAARNIQMVFQDPYSSLNPLRTVGASVAEPLVTHLNLSKAEVDHRVAELLEQVGLDPAYRFRRPTVLSGGERQRVSIARAIALEPKVLVCDEPTSALDLSTQSQVINLLTQLSEERGIALLLISHDLSIVRHASDRIAVMYLGRLVEVGPTDDIYDNPKHPYTQALVASALPPTPGHLWVGEVPTGDLPSAKDDVTGCAFRTRCPVAVDRCADERPKLTTVSTSVQCACHLASTDEFGPSSRVLDQVPTAPTADPLS